jgi:hypothetical protein
VLEHEATAAQKAAINHRRGRLDFTMFTSISNPRMRLRRCGDRPAMPASPFRPQL